MNAPVRGHGSDTYELIGRLIDSIGSPSLPDSLLDLAVTEVESDAEMILLYPTEGRPLVILDRLVAAERPLLYGDYLSGLYRLSPFHQAASTCRNPTVCRLSDIAPASFRQSEYFRLYFSRIGVSDLLGVLVPLVGQGVLHLSFGRKRGRPPFGIAHARRLSALLPVIGRAAARHWPPVIPEATPSSSEPRRSFGASLPELTAREAEIVQAMLSGHSAKSAARLLSISPETVKVHRKHIYAKLEVSSQSELFSLYLDRIRQGSAA